MSKTLNLALVRTLRLRGVVLAASRDHVLVDSPKGVITPPIRCYLRELKPDLLSALESERRIVGMSLDEFSGQNCAIEFRVTWMDETLWLVPTVAHVSILAEQGVSRGRIWTGRELADLLAIPCLPAEDLRGITRLKTAFGASIVAVENTERAAELLQKTIDCDESA